MPVDESVVGKFAKATEPFIEQVMVGAEGAQGDELERKLYIARKLIEKARAARQPAHFTAWPWHLAACPCREPQTLSSPLFPT